MIGPPSAPRRQWPAASGYAVERHPGKSRHPVCGRGKGLFRESKLATPGRRANVFAADTIGATLTDSNVDRCLPTEWPVHSLGWLPRIFTVPPAATYRGGHRHEGVAGRRLDRVPDGEEFTMTTVLDKPRIPCRYRNADGWQCSLDALEDEEYCTFHPPE